MPPAVTRQAYRMQTYDRQHATEHTNLAVTVDQSREEGGATKYELTPIQRQEHYRIYRDEGESKKRQQESGKENADSLRSPHMIHLYLGSVSTKIF